MESYFASLDVEELDLDTTAEERNRKVSRGNQSKRDPSETETERRSRRRGHKHASPSPRDRPSPIPASSANSNEDIDFKEDYCESGDDADSNSDFELELEPTTSSSPSAPRRHYSQRLGRYIEFGQCIVCGGDHHKRECPQWRRKVGPDGEFEKRHRRHLGGRVGLTQKSQKFVEWIVSKWNVEDLRKGGIIDVAGGQGRVSTELQLRYRIPCTVIDPRAIVFTDKQKRFLKFQLDHPERFIPGRPELPSQKQMLFEDDFLENPENRALWERARLIIGLHPDEATERIVQLSLQTKKDFAVLPCCVFPTKFSERRTRDGLPVLYYPDLCKYLEELDPSIQKDTVPIPGRDIVLYKRT